MVAKIAIATLPQTRFYRFPTVALEIIYAEDEKPTRSKIASRLSKPAYFRDKNVCAVLAVQKQLGLEG